MLLIFYHRKYYFSKHTEWTRHSKRKSREHWLKVLTSYFIWRANSDAGCFFFLASRSLFGRQTVVIIKHKSGKNFFYIFFLSFSQQNADYLFVTAAHRVEYTHIELFISFDFFFSSHCFLFHNFSSRFRWAKRNDWTNEKKINVDQRFQTAFA